ncbi:hypothetical protein [Bradyrhizobium sp. 613_E4_N2_2]
MKTALVATWLVFLAAEILEKRRIADIAIGMYGGLVIAEFIACYFP